MNPIPKNTPTSPAALENAPLSNLISRRQMGVGLLAAYSGFSRLRVHWHLRPKVFTRLPENILQRYATALQVPVAELCALPAADNCDRL